MRNTLEVRRPKTVSQHNPFDMKRHFLSELSRWEITEDEAEALVMAFQPAHLKIIEFDLDERVVVIR